MVSSSFEVVAPRKPAHRAARQLVFNDLAAQQQRIRRELERAIARVLDHGQYIMGPEVEDLEHRLARFCRVRHAVTCASGTDALLIAMMAKRVKPGDAVLCPAFTYTATPESVALLGASPVFVDVKDDTFNIDPSGLEAGVEAARGAGLDPVGIIAVDLFGQVAEYEQIATFARANGLWVLADGAQSFGAERSGSKVGTFGDVTATSFFPAKPLGCYGDGGAILTNDDDLAAVMRSIRLHGKGNDKYDIVRVGVNSRLDTLQAAILIEKLEIFPEEIAQRQAIADHYTDALHDVALTPRIDKSSSPVWAQYTIKLAGSRRDHLKSALSAAGIPTSVFYSKPVHQQIAFRSYPVAANPLAVSERLPQEVLSLPMHAYLAREEQDFIIAAIRHALAEGD